MRILKAIDARPRRTIRVALWGGEEQGLLGSKAWVAQHLAGDANAAARDKFDVYFNIDNGTGPIYGWYLQNKEEVRPIFDGWLEPLKAIGARRNVIEPVGSTDHLSFIDAGVPGLQPDSGLRQLRHPHAPHQHGHRGTLEGRGPSSGGDRHGDVCVQRGEPGSKNPALRSPSCHKSPSPNAADHHDAHRTIAARACLRPRAAALCRHADAPRAPAGLLLRPPSPASRQLPAGQVRARGRGRQEC